MSSQFNELIQSQSIASITPQQILAAGEPVFFDIRTSPDIYAINKLIQSYARIHAPTYGQPIPLSGLTSSAQGSETILAPSSNEIRKILAISVTNAGGAAPIVGHITLGGMYLAPFAADPSQTGAVTISSNLISSKELPIAAVVTSGGASDLTTTIASILVVQ